MKHKLALTNKERINIWLELCDFTFRLMENTLSPNELKQRLKKIRGEHEKADRVILEGLSKIHKK